MKMTPRSIPTPENSLVARAMQGDLPAFNRLVLTYQDLAYHHAFAMLGQPVPAGEAVQRGMLSAYQALPTFRGGSFRAWLLSHVTRAAEAPDLRKDSSAQVSRPPTLPSNPGSGAISLERDLANLPGIYRGAVTLVDVYQFDYAEAAQALRVSAKTLLQRLALARQQIQAGLQRGAYEQDYRGPPVSRKDVRRTRLTGARSSGVCEESVR